MHPIHSVDFLYVMMVWGPAVFLFLAGLGLLISESRHVQSLAFVIPSAWAVVLMFAIVITAFDSRSNHEFMEAAFLQLLGVAVVAMFFGFVLGIKAILPGRKRSATS